VALVEVEPMRRLDSIESRRALVLFEDRRDVSYLRVFRRGFRHCFCVVGADDSWIILDPIKSGLVVLRVDGASEDELTTHYTSTGRIVLAGDVPVITPGGTSHLRPLTCVEIVKRTLKIRAAHVFTPAQLYSLLIGRLGFREVQHPSMPLDYKQK
jgi:hypothetical protein